MATIPRDPQVIDDLERHRGAEQVDAETTREFAYQGRSYRLDLTTKNAEELDEVLAEYLDAAQPVSNTPRPARARSASGAGATNQSRLDRALTGEMRKWAVEQKMKVNERGRIPDAIRNAYFGAHPNHPQHPDRSAG